ncbi:MAG: hypothetical protein JSV65_15730 [Armatimonadota bacterium]|nr:MAG: hypothetical protein JSV65_15730 [Armatimonadota bacterium]
MEDTSSRCPPVALIKSESAGRAAGLRGAHGRTSNVRQKGAVRLAAPVGMEVY